MEDDIGCLITTVCWILILWKLTDIVYWFLSHLAWV